MKKRLFAFCLALLPLLLFSCKKEKESPYGKARFVISHKVGGEKFLLDKDYKNALGQSYSIREWRYFLSNVYLENSKTGKKHFETDSYHLVSPENSIETWEFTFQNIPEGEYDRIGFAIGVDSAANAVAVVKGDLDPNSNMSWSWLAGYKFLLLEGFCTDAAGVRQALVYHIGGNANYQALLFEAPCRISAGEETALLFETDLSEVFSRPADLDFTDYRNVQSGAKGAVIALNYADMMRFKGVR